MRDQREKGGGFVGVVICLVSSVSCSERHQFHEAGHLPLTSGFNKASMCVLVTVSDQNKAKPANQSKLNLNVG